MNQRQVFLAAALAAATLPALADTEAGTPAAYAQPIASADPSGNPVPWKGALSRAEVTSAFLQARASRTLPVGDAYDDPMVMKMAGARPQPADATTASASRVMGAAPAQPVTLDGYRFVGGEAGYAPANSPTFR